MLFDELFTNSPEDIFLDDEAEELEDVEDEVISDDGTDIDMIANITDDDVMAAEVEDIYNGEDSEEDNNYEDNDDDEDDEGTDTFINYDVDEEEDDDKKDMEDYMISEEEY